MFLRIYFTVYVLTMVAADINNKISRFDDSMLQYVMQQISKLTEEMGAIKTQIGECQKKTDTTLEIDSAKNELTSSLEKAKSELTSALDTKMDNLKGTMTTELGQQDAKVEKYAWVNTGRYCIWKSGPCPPGFSASQPFQFSAGDNDGGNPYPRIPLGDSTKTSSGSGWDRVSIASCCK